METKITFEKLLDGTCVITVKGKNIHGETYLRQEIIKESAVFDALKSKIVSFSDVEITDKAIEYAEQFEIRNKPIETAKIKSNAVRDYYKGFKDALTAAAL